MVRLHFIFIFIVLSCLLVRCGRCGGGMEEVVTDTIHDTISDNPLQIEYVGNQILRGRLGVTKGIQPVVEHVLITEWFRDKDEDWRSVVADWIGKNIEVKGDVYDRTCEPGVQCRMGGHIIYMKDIEYLKEIDIMVASTCTDAPADDGGEVTLLAFEFDKWPVSACEYDRCVESGKCTGERVQPPVKTSRCGRRAVGMSWKNAQEYCETRGMDVQNQFHDFCIRSTLGDAYDLKDVIDGDGTQIVTAGFRCVRPIEAGATRVTIA